MTLWSLAEVAPHLGGRIDQRHPEHQAPRGEEGRLRRPGRADAEAAVARQAQVHAAPLGAAGQDLQLAAAGGGWRGDAAGWRGLASGRPRLGPDFGPDLRARDRRLDHHYKR